MQHILIQANYLTSPLSYLLTTLWGALKAIGRGMKMLGARYVEGRQRQANREIAIILSRTDWQHDSVDYLEYELNKGTKVADLRSKQLRGDLRAHSL